LTIIPSYSTSLYSSSTLLLLDYTPPALHLYTYQIDQSTMPVTPAIEPASYPAIRARIPRTIKKAQVTTPTPTPSQKTLKLTTKERKQRRRALQEAIYSNVTLVTPLAA
jgi:hypothetical protein